MDKLYFNIHNHSILETTQNVQSCVFSNLSKTFYQIVLNIIICKDPLPLKISDNLVREIKFIFKYVFNYTYIIVVILTVSDMNFSLNIHSLKTCPFSEQTNQERQFYACRWLYLIKLNLFQNVIIKYFGFYPVVGVNVYGLAYF